MFFVHFEQLTTQPELTMRKLYEFLEEDYYQHDFNYVEQVTKEDDYIFGFEGLHTIRNKVEPIPPRYPTVLGEVAKKYTGLNFWQNL
jgi:sulfotransferase